MARRTKIINAADTTLNGAINDVTTSITVTDGSIYPSEGDFYITLEDEILLVTARSSNVLTVTRGVDGSTAASHADATAVSAIITQTNLENYLEESISWDLCGNNFKEWDCRHRLLSHAGAILTVSDFTRDGPSTGDVFDNEDGSIYVSPGAIGIISMQAMRISQPTPPYTLTAHLAMTNPATTGTSGNYQGLWWRDSATDRWLGIMARVNGNVNFGRWTNQTTFTTTLNNPEMFSGTNDVWLRLSHDGTNLEAFWSSNGRNWLLVGTDTVGTWLTPNQIAWGFQSRNKAEHKFACHLWCTQ